MIRRPVLCLALLSMAACGGGGGGPAVTSAGFAGIGSDGLILTDPGAQEAAAGSIRRGESGYAYAVQSNGSDVSARAALINPGAVTGRPVTGTGRFAATYQINEIRNTNTDREITEVEGSIPLTVNFDTGALRGSAGALAVTGQMAQTGAGFTGFTTWRGVTGDLRGRANGTTIVGAFAGNSPTSVYAGGFTGNGSVTP